MNKNNENNQETNGSQTHSDESKFYLYVKKNSNIISLVLVIIIILVWAITKMNNMQKAFLEEQKNLTEAYVSRFESMSISSMEQTAKVFSWAIRGEMLRQNLDQVNQYFSSFIRELGIIKLQLIEPESAKILISTDKKDEGTIIENTLILQAERIYHIAEDEHVKIISPVMGLDSRIGVLVIEFNPGN